MSRYSTTKWGWGRTEAPQDEVKAWDVFPWKLVYALAVGAPALLLFHTLGLKLSLLTLVLYVLGVAVAGMAAFIGVIFVHCRLVDGKTPFDGSLLKFTNAEFEAQWKGKKIPVLVLYDAYFAGKVEFTTPDLLAVLYRRYEFVSFVFTLEHARYFLFKLLPELLVHSKQQDTDQVRDHYDRGNDFYEKFLGPMMIYTSGIFHSEDDTLEQAQENKLRLVFNKIHLQKGERLLDIGCGWGTLALYAARDYGADVTGVTLAKEQTAWATEKFKTHKVDKSARVLCMDYRDIPAAKYNKITCLEMAEHVGVRLFPKFLRQVSDMLEDDGIFFLQIAGLRRAWQYEDLQWGCFMGNYVFPGADASCPLGWVVDQVEGAGFEVHSVETIGIHYSATIKRWYDNWVKNQGYIRQKYGERWYRTWLWFLAWAVISPEQGSASCYQLVLHKNTRGFDRKGTWLVERSQYKL